MTKYKVDNFNNEIEFLRAISVILVLFFHFELFYFKGGFIGVDVFFVISGYLIDIYTLISMCLFLGNQGVISEVIHLAQKVDSRSKPSFIGAHYRLFGFGLCGL